MTTDSQRTPPEARSMAMHDLDAEFIQRVLQWVKHDGGGDFFVQALAFSRARLRIIDGLGDGS